MIRMYQLFFLALLTYVNCNAWKLVSGNSNVRQESTFSFPIGAYYLSDNGTLYVGADKNAQSKNFALSYLESGKDEFKPLAPEEITINGDVAQKNPLYDAAITHISQINSHNIIVATAKDMGMLYNISRAGGVELFKANILDANGKESNSIVGLASNEKKGLAFVAVKGKEKEHFGRGGSGIAVVSFSQETKDTELTPQDLENLQKSLTKVQTPEERQQITKNIITDDKGKQKRRSITKRFQQIFGATHVVKEGEIAQPIIAAPFSVISDFLKIGSDLVLMDDVIDMYWHEGLSRLYVAVRVQGGHEETDGAYGLTVGRIESDGSLIFSPIVAKSLLKAGTPSKIVAGKGIDTQVSIHKVRSMLTSTILDYLIVLGAEGAPLATRRTVYALPLLNMRDVKGEISADDANAHGTLASINGTPFEAFGNDRAHIFLGRHFIQAPETPQDLYDVESSAAQVGGGPLDVGPIHDLLVKDDAVYAVIKDPDNKNETASGVYRSQALFGTNGVVVAWTLWQKVTEFPEEVAALMFEGKRYNRIALTGSDSIKNVNRAEWDLQSVGFAGFVKVINDQFNKEQAGIQELIDFSPLTPGLKGISLLCATGLSKVVLAQMVPLTEYNNQNKHMICKRGELDKAIENGVSALIFSGGVLDTLGPICAAEITANNTHGWLFVGGVYGLAVFCNPDGSGWQMPAGIGNGFSGLQKDMLFKKIGNYEFVRKLISDDQFLYVLTDHYLDRIDLRAINFASDTLCAVRLASAQELASGPYALLKDVIISQKCALLAHTNGLSRVGDDKDIRFNTAQTLAWTPLQVYDAAGPVSGLIPISITGRGQDVARFSAGQVYVITGSIGKNSARLNRLAIQNVTHKPMSEETITPLRDFVAVDRISNFVNIGAFSSLFATDGTMFFTVIDRNKSKSALLTHSFGTSKITIPLPFKDASNIVRIVRSSAWGNWLIAGDFGLLINE